jgi:hypothetical protein
VDKIFLAVFAVHLWSMIALNCSVFTEIGEGPCCFTYVGSLRGQKTLVD